MEALHGAASYLSHLDFYIIINWLRVEVLKCDIQKSDIQNGSLLNQNIYMKILRNATFLEQLIAKITVFY